MSGQLAFDRRNNVIDQLWSDFYRNLPGPFLLFDLHSAPGHLIARLTRPIPYLNPGTTWMLSKKYEGMRALHDNGMV
jgi:hypothetical protein